MQRIEFTLTNEHGMHARPAGLFVNATSKFQSEVFMIKGDVRVNAKSIIGVLRLAGSKGDTLAVEVAGSDENDAMIAIKDIISKQFGE